MIDRKLFNNLATSLGVFVIFVILILFIFFAPGIPDDKVKKGSEGLLTYKEKLTLENEMFKARLQVAGGAMAVAGLAFAFWRIILAGRDVSIREEGQITDRFSRAIEHLGAARDSGDPKLEIRLGGVYALERLARDAKDDEFYWQIMETLTAYVRENAPAPEEKEEEDEERAEIDSEKIPEPRKDIQAIMTVLGRRTQREIDKEKYLDLSNTDLRRCDLREAHLERADLSGARLEHANLFRAHLKRANLLGARLEDVWLVGAHLGRAPG